MIVKPSRDVSATSTGHALGESTYLDARFLAAQPEYEQMLRWAGIKEGWQVLDAGSGSGSYLPLLCELVGADGSVTALDLAPENIQACEKRLTDLEPACRTEVRVGSILQLPFDDGTFDAVWCANTSQYLTDEELATALAELKRVTKSGGLVAVKEADVTCFQLAHIDPAVMWRYFTAARESDQQLAGVIRAIELPHRLRQEAGLANVRAQTTIIERFGPLKSVEKMALRDLLEFTAKTALNTNLPESDMPVWQRFLQMLQDGHMLDESDFFVREGAITAAGEVQ